MKNKNDLIAWISANSSIIDDEYEFMDMLEDEIKSNDYSKALTNAVMEIINDFRDSDYWDDAKEALIDLLFD